VLAKRACYFLRQRFVEIGNHHAHALAVEFLRDAFAEALRAAGHDRNFAAEATRNLLSIMYLLSSDLLPFRHFYHACFISNYRETI